VLALAELAGGARVQVDAVGEAVELRGPDLDQLAKRGIERDGAVEGGDRTIGLGRLAAQVNPAASVGLWTEG
jgi:hypothetical protein